MALSRATSAHQANSSNPRAAPTTTPIEPPLTASIKPTLVPMEPPRTALHSTSSKGVLLSSNGVLLDIPLAASPGTTTKVHHPQQACSKGGAAFPRQLTGPHEYPHLCQNFGSRQFPLGFPFGGAHNAFLHAKLLAHGFPSPGGFPFLFFTFPNFPAEHCFPHSAMLPQGCEDPQFPGGRQTAPKLPLAIANTTKSSTRVTRLS